MHELPLTTAGIVLLTVAFIAYGGTFLLRVVNKKQPTNELQRNYFRAGHAHAGVLVMLGLLVNIYTSAPGVPGWAGWCASFILWAAILMPAGFFLSVTGSDPQQPNRLKYLIWVGALFLVAGVIGSGIGLLVA